ncbi:MAG TPA: nitroreductase family protein [Thermoleophilia bacterium]
MGNREVPDAEMNDLPVALAELPVAEWAAAIDVRHSARTYTGDPVDATSIDGLVEFCAQLPGKEVARVVVAPVAPAAVFTGMVGGYGKVLDAPSALIMIGDEAAFAVEESVGYLGEAAILEATARDLGTCWVAGFFDRRIAAELVSLAPGERIFAISPIGHAKPRPRSSERMLKRIVGAHKRKPIEEVAPGFDAGIWPDWAAEGVRLAVIAPSAVNRQPWRFELEPGTADSVTVSIVEKGAEGRVPRRLDCGIAMLHFQVGSRVLGARGTWEILPSPQVARFRATTTA